MADLTLPAPYPFTTGEVVAASDYRNILYSASAPGSSLALINGLLDEDNIASGTEVQPEHTQRGSHIDGHGNAGNLSLNFFSDVFGEYSDSAFDSTDADEAKVLPGCTVRWFQRWTGGALLKWTAFWTSTSNGTDKFTWAFLEVDGTYVLGQHRGVCRVLDSGATPPRLEGYRRSRLWSGHTIIAAAEGWHEAAIKVVAHNDITQSRAWARNMSVLQFKLQA